MKQEKLTLPKKTKGMQVDIPDYIKQDSVRGNENVAAEDVLVPRLEIVQALSPALNPTNPAYIAEAKVGLLYNSVTREVYGNKLMVCPVYYIKQYLVWKDRKQGGGFFGAYGSLDEATARAEAEGGANAGISVVDTPQHLCLLVGLDDHMEEIIVAMPRTKSKISRQWNSLVRISSGDRFSRLYSLGVQPASNNKGDFYNYYVNVAGFAPKAVYLHATEMYDSLVKGGKGIKMDTADYDATSEDSEEM